jgi:hypothetical protein
MGHESERDGPEEALADVDGEGGEMLGLRKRWREHRREPSEGDSSWCGERQEFVLKRDQVADDRC